MLQRAIGSFVLRILSCSVADQFDPPGDQTGTGGREENQQHQAAALALVLVADLAACGAFFESDLALPIDEIICWRKRDPLFVELLFQSECWEVSGLISCRPMGRVEEFLNSLK